MRDVRLLLGFAAERTLIVTRVERLAALPAEAGRGRFARPGPGGR